MTFNEYYNKDYLINKIIAFHICPKTQIEKIFFFTGSWFGYWLSQNYWKNDECERGEEYKVSYRTIFKGNVEIKNAFKNIINKWYDFKHANLSQASVYKN